MLSGSLLLVFSARQFKDIRANLGVVLAALIFFVQATLMLNQLRLNSTEASQSPVSEATLSSAAGSAAQAEPAAKDFRLLALGQWRLNTYAQRLDDAIALLKGLREQQIFKASIRSESEYQLWAAALVACLEAQAADAELMLVQLATRCTQDDGLKAYLSP